MCNKPITHIVSLTGPPRDSVFVKKLVCCKVNVLTGIANKSKIFFVNKGPSINYVTRISRFLDPLPLCRILSHFR